MNDGLTKIIINAKGIPNDENQITLNLVKLMNDEPVQDDQYFEEAQAKIKEFNEDPEWSDYIMDYEEKILEREQDAREEGVLEGKKDSAKILASALKKAGNTKQEIMQQLEQNYGNVFSKKQLNEFMAQS